MLCSNGSDTMHVVCTELLCIVSIGLFVLFSVDCVHSAEFSTVNAGLGRPVFWKAPDLNRLSRK